MYYQRLLVYKHYFVSEEVKMNYVIPKTQLRIFHKALQSLSKVGGEIYFEPKPDQLLAKTINSRKYVFNR